MPRAIALLVALNLGLLSPISCVIHCALYQLFAAPPAISLFLCGEHGASATSPTPVDAPPTAPTPRAMYKLVSLPLSLLALVRILICALLVSAPPTHRSIAFVPPTPPPRPLLG